VKDLVTDVAVYPTPDDPRFAPLIAASRDLDLVVGFIEEDARHRLLSCRRYRLGSRGLRASQSLFPTYRLFDDARFFAAGTSFRAFDTRWGRWAY